VLGKSRQEIRNKCPRTIFVSNNSWISLTYENLFGNFLKDHDKETKDRFSDMVVTGIYHRTTNISFNIKTIKLFSL